MPAGPLDSTTDPSGAPASPSQPDGLPAWQTEPRLPGEGGRRCPSRSPPSLALRDTSGIFHTIEQLTVKLHRLKDMERAHRELLWSLGGQSAGGTTPGGSFHAEATRWTDSSLSSPARDALVSDPRDSHQPGPCSEDGSSTPLEDSAAHTASPPGL